MSIPDLDCFPLAVVLVIKCQDIEPIFLADMRLSSWWISSSGDSMLASDWWIILRVGGEEESLDIGDG